MGSSNITYVICGIELDPDDYFEEYQVVKPPQWCDHQETFEPSNAPFCPECGKARPTEKTFSYSRMVPDAFPDKAVEAMKEKLGTDFTDQITHYRDLEGVLGPLPNNLSFFDNVGNSHPDKVRLFLGKHLTTIDRWSECGCLQWTPETFQKLAKAVEGKASEYGFEGNAKLIMCTLWM